MKHPLFQLAITIAIRMAFLWACMAAALANSYSVFLEFPLETGGCGIVIAESIGISINAEGRGHSGIYRREGTVNHPVFAREWRAGNRLPLGSSFRTKQQILDCAGLEVGRIMRVDMWECTYVAIPHWMNILFFGSIASTHFCWHKRQRRIN